MVPVSEPPKKVVPVFEPGKRSCQYLMITLKVVPLYDVNPFFSSIEGFFRWTAPEQKTTLARIGLGMA